MPIEYIDSNGRVPRWATTAEGADMLRQLLLTAIVLGEAERSLDVPGFGAPETVQALMGYELKISGIGNGVIRVEALKKPS